MKNVKKWNFKKHEYEDAEIDDRCSMYEVDMEAIVKCPNCNEDVKFGDCYTSRQYHNNYGLGYAVCPKCYEIERKLDESFSNK